VDVNRASPGLPGKDRFGRTAESSEDARANRIASACGQREFVPIVLERPHRDLMSGERSRDHHHFAVMKLVTAPVIRPALQIPVRHLSRDAQHGSDRSIVGDTLTADSMPYGDRSASNNVWRIR
jgi:hypothetical protein